MSAFTTLFNIFLERIMTDVLEDREGSLSIGGRIITNLRFADDRERRRAYQVSQPTRQGVNNIWHGDHRRKRLSQ